MFATIREKNTSLPMPAAAASLMARSWDWLGANTPLRGPAMFSSDFIAELQARLWGGGGGCAQPLGMLPPHVLRRSCKGGSRQ